MTDKCHCIIKKKKKSKQKQKRKQSTIIKPVQPKSVIFQPVPITQYIYRDNLALNTIQDKMRDNAILQSLVKTQNNALVKDTKTNSIETQTEPKKERKQRVSKNTNSTTTTTQTDIQNIIEDGLANVHKSTSIPIQPLNNDVDIFSQAMYNSPSQEPETDYENIVIRTPAQRREEENVLTKGIVDLNQKLDLPLTRKGKLDGRTKAVKAYYREQRLRDTIPTEIVNDEDDEEEYILSPIKRKPSK